jgi:hypothetical protein
VQRELCQANIVCPSQNPLLAFLFGVHSMLKIKSVLRVAGLAIVGAVAAASQTHAQTVNVPFDGNILNTCTFGAPVAGVLAKSGNAVTVEGAGGIPGLTGGTAGSVTLNCLGGGNVTVAAPVVVAVPAGFNPPVRQAIVRLGTTADYTNNAAGGNYDTGAWNKPTAALAVPAGAQTLTVGMIAGTPFSNGAIPFGNYGYTVTLTAAPN